MAHKLIWGADLYKGWKLDRKSLLGGQVDDAQPFQQLSLEEKTIDWIKAVADYYDIVGWNNVSKKAWKIRRNYMMRYGKLNPSDYIINPSPQEMNAAVGLIIPDSQSPLEQNYSLVSTFVDVLRGEFLKKENSWTIEAVDLNSKNQMFQVKEEGFRDAVMQVAMLQKQQALAKMGLAPEVDQQAFEMEMQKAKQHLEAVELKARTFRTTGVQWAEKVLKIHEKRYNLHELEPDGFECGLITDSEFWHIDLLEDDFRLELINTMYADYHKGINQKYVSQGDYFLWFDFMSAGDIVNRYGRRLKEEDMKKLRDVHTHTAGMMLLTDQEKALQGAYYDLTKPWSQATDLNPVMNDAKLGYDLAHNYAQSPNFTHNLEVDLFSPNYTKSSYGAPQMFRVMRLYWRSMRQIGWLTKIHRDGTRDKPTWIDENFKVTVEPVYDKSKIKEETKDNLLYGEHIDWTWAPEWRHVMKISPNERHAFWIDSRTQMEAIYIDGGPVKFQFRGRNNPFDSLPPIEGCNFSYINTEEHSFIDRMRGHQILFNICMNKVPKKFLKDYGNKVAIDTRSYSLNNSGQQGGLSPREEYEERLRESDILEYKLSREAMEGMGQPALPQVLALSTIQEAMFYLEAADRIKWMAGETVGITRQRVGAQKASETATSIQAGIHYSETQTLKYFEQHSNLMQRVRQRMLDAAQYYSTFTEHSKDIYQNDMHENIFLEIEGTDNLLPHYNIYLESKANVNAALSKITDFLIQENTLPIKASAKVEAIIERSIPKVLNIIKTSELEQDRMMREQMEAEQAQLQQKLEAEERIKQAELAHESAENEKDRANDVEVATIRALGGIQTDNNADGATDASTNLEPFFRQQEIADKRQIAQDTNTMKRQLEQDRLMVEREKAQKELEKERIKGDYALKVAKENK